MAAAACTSLACRAITAASDGSTISHTPLEASTSMHLDSGLRRIALTCGSGISQPPQSASPRARENTRPPG
eukprot:6193499-Pleurochrysis_carterae.AAC.2